MGRDAALSPASDKPVRMNLPAVQQIYAGTGHGNPDLS